MLPHRIPLSSYLHATLTVCWPPLKKIMNVGLLVVPEMERVCDWPEWSVPLWGERVKPGSFVTTLHGASPRLEFVTVTGGYVPCWHCAPMPGGVTLTRRALAVIDHAFAAAVGVEFHANLLGPVG